jgi:thiol-disulfide isomerase/thioredoxin
MKRVFLFLASIGFLNVVIAQHQATDFSVNNNQGEEFTLFEVLDSGQYVLLDFMATWCGPCAQSVPVLSQVYHDYGCNQEELFILSVSIDGDDYDTQVFHNLYGGDHPIVSGDEGGGSHVYTSYGIESFPSYILISPQREIVYQSTSSFTYSDLQETIDANGISPNVCPPVYQTQVLEIHEGWNLLAKNVVSPNESMETLFESVSDKLVILKDVEGNVYWPLFGLNTIGEYNVNEGYLAKFTEDVSIEIYGALIDEHITIDLNSGWNIMPYYASESINSIFYFESISENIVIVKDEIGQVYLPEYNYSNMGALDIGKSYYIKVNQNLQFQY